MKHMLKLVVLAAASALLSSAAPAQFVGTWKLNVEKSQFGNSQAPKSEIRTVKASGSGYKISWKGEAADGSPIDFTLMTKMDGKPAPMVGKGVPGGAATASVKRIDVSSVAHAARTLPTSDIACFATRVRHVRFCALTRGIRYARNG